MKGRKQWRCFYCDQLFRSYREAKIHFGDDGMTTPACKIPEQEGRLVDYIRRLEAEIQLHRDDAHEMILASYAIESRAQSLAYKAEEEGYNKGVSETIDMIRSMGFEPYPETLQEAVK